MAGNPVFRAFVRPLSRAGLLPSALYRRFPVEGEFQTIINDNHSFMYCSAYEDAIGRGLFWRGAGGLEPETIAYITPFLKNAAVFADIGANTGHFALYACAVNPYITVHAFEPVARNFEHLRRNVARNGWARRCQIHPCAVGAENGRAMLHVPRDALPSSASLHAGGFQNLAGDLTDVDVVRLDSALAHTPPDVVKIDVEGFEHLVLQGMAGLFAAGHRPHIVFECHAGGPAREIMEILDPLGYGYYHLSRQGPVAFKAIAPQNAGRAWNWAAVPQT